MSPLTEEAEVGVADGAPSLDEHLERLRATYTRLDPAATARAIAAGAVLVDIRPVAQRVVEGEVPGSVIVERNVLEWRFAPTSRHRHPAAPGPGDDRTVVIMCSEGYASSLAAVSLRELGVERATDLVGGFLAWQAAGLPVVPPASRARAVVPAV